MKSFRPNATILILGKQGVGKTTLIRKVLLPALSIAGIEVRFTEDEHSIEIKIPQRLLGPKP